MDTNKVRFRFLHVLETVAAALLVALLALGGATLLYGSPRNAFNALRGRSIVVAEDTRSFGRASADKAVRVEYDLTNISSRPLNIVGSRMSCTCMVLAEQLPISIAAGGKRTFAVFVYPPSSPLSFRQEIRLYTDSPGQTVILLIVTGEVIAKPHSQSQVASE